MPFKLKTFYLKPINFIVVIFLILTLINEVLSLEEESKDKYYLITFQFNKENDEEIDDPKESNNSLSFVNSQMKNILELIVDNKDTYENKELLNEYSDIKEKRDNNGDSFEEIVKLINENSSSLINVLYENEERGIYTIHALLSNELYLIVKDMPYVTECIEDDIIVDTDPIIPIDVSPTDDIEDDEEYNNDTDIENYYSLSSIKNETLWDDIGIDKNAYNHLSLLSQGKFDNTLINKYDTNYYYPRSAGKGVNIVIIDSGFMFDHRDFNTDNRKVVCEAICVGRGCVQTDSDPILSKFSIIEPQKHLYPNHGTKVASTAAGTIYGVAKNANIYGITVDMAISSIVTAINYVLRLSSSKFPPEKTIINISSGSYTKHSVYENVLKDAEEKGYMIITSGGNDNIDGCVKTKREYIRDNEKKIAKDFHYPSGYDSTIGVGSINNNYSSSTLDANYSVLYSKASFSNYGECVDLWAPGYVYAALPSEKEIEILDKPSYCKTLSNKRDFEIKEDEKILKQLCTDKHNMFRKIKVISSTKKRGSGTSFSSPIVAGISALFISEFPDITFNQSILRKFLEAVSLKDIINFNNISKHSRNIFVNNGKHIIYSKDNIYPKNHCGPNVGNSICPNNGCCSKNGLCGTSDSFCEIKNGCQSKFGNCNNKNTRPQTQNTTTSLKTTQKAIVKSTTTILKTTAKTTVKPTPTKNNTNTNTVIEKDIPISTNGKCGPKYGRCKDNKCCSQYGYCGQTTGYCDSGCQKDYGRCNNVILDIPLTTEKANNTTKKSNITIKTSINTKPNESISNNITTNITTTKGNPTITKVNPTVVTTITKKSTPKITSTAVTTTTTNTVPKITSTAVTTTTTNLSLEINPTFIPEKLIEINSAIDNPYRGWYHGSKSVDISDYTKYDCKYIKRLSNIRKEKIGLQYVGIQLEEFKNREISKEGLNNIRSLFSEYREKAKNDGITRLIIRFYYDNADNCKRNPNGTPRTTKINKRDNFNNTIDENYNEINDDSFYPIKKNDNEYISLSKNDIIYVTDKLNYNLPLFKNKINNNKVEDDGNDDDEIEETSTADAYDDDEDYLENIDDLDNDESIFFKQNNYLSVEDFNENNILSLTDDKLNDYMDQMNFISSNTSLTIKNKINKREKISKEITTDMFNVNSVKLFTNSINYNGKIGQCFIKEAIDNCELYTTEELEPDNIETIKTHIKQLSTIVNEFKDIIYIHQGVFIGTWGEMHSSFYSKNYKDIPDLINTINNYFDPSIYLAVRTPRHYRMIINYNKITNKKLLISRLGLFNDGLFYNDNDYGTYGNNDINENNGIIKAHREDEIKFQSNICINVPSGGESVLNKNTMDFNNTSMDNTYYNIKNYNNFYTCNDYSNTIHLSYLNDDYSKPIYIHWSNYTYNNSTNPIWNGENGHDYISNHLGYRYVIKETIFSGNTLNINVTNVGYSPAYIKFDMKIFLVNTNNLVEKEINVDEDNRLWKSNNLYTFKISFDFNSYSIKNLNKKYNVYFKLIDPIFGSTIKFANALPFKKEYGYKIGTLIIN